MNRANKLTYTLICLCCFWTAFVFGEYPQNLNEPSEHFATESTSQSPSEIPSSPYEIPKAGEVDTFFHQLLNMAFSLATILVVILLISYVLKRVLNTRIQQLNTNSLIKILERRSLTPKTAIYVLEVIDQPIVIAESVNGITLLSHTKEKLSTASQFEKVLDEKTT